MKLLAIETATEACSAALMIDGDIAQRFEIAPREHASKILVMIDQLMADAQLNPSQLDAVAFGRGPGAFMGVRIAAGIIQGIAFGAELPVIPVSTLAAIAQGTSHDNVLVAIDARMREIYWGQYRRSHASANVTAAAPEQLLAPADVTPADASLSWVGVGTGWQTYDTVLKERLPGVVTIDDNPYPAARSVVQLAVEPFQQGQWVEAAEALPVYLRDQVAEKPRSRG
ncbi:MAG: tRNA (adenosine(37)-N6)-threonylcarbamoyltransferase complex dimerization subunit type 1 TsaB [Gammaproteobacteria bacterium]|jgi:tRNA threonylcarbamoyladenosine biosynthesis protein TsaB